ncbi:hypothetical protein EV356DRAFT_534404 [Viridothelium virens]|uniref:Uncharacterized protein n=1 Tax=Viridothelium virens TaxID=1048519 RepID=A0A6A6H4N6_VIRVR|nr:hypothetical protein EV356DRAFT_534404 [Viridothelium virens]
MALEPTSLNENARQAPNSPLNTKLQQSPTTRPEHPPGHSTRQPPLSQIESEILATITSPQYPPETIKKAKSQLDALIAHHSTRASLYLLRANTTHLFLAPSNSKPSHEGPPLSSHQQQHLTGSILSDLAEAIALATPRTTNEPIGPEEARILAAAHTQRGQLLCTAAESGDLSALRGSVSLGVPAAEGEVGKGALEELGRRDLFWGARYAGKAGRRTRERGG